jgi:hypothetical protein
VAKSGDPVGERRKAKAANTLPLIATAYLEREGREGELRSIGERRRIFERNIFPALGAHQIESIKRSEIMRVGYLSASIHPLVSFGMETLAMDGMSADLGASQHSFVQSREPRGVRHRLTFNQVVVGSIPTWLASLVQKCEPRAAWSRWSESLVPEPLSAP